MRSVPRKQRQRGLAAALCLLGLLSGCVWPFAQKADDPLAALKQQAQSTRESNGWPAAQTRPDHLALARSLMDRRLYEVALGELAAAAQDQPHSSEVRHLQGICRRELGDLEAARALFELVIAADPTFAPAHNALGITRDRLQEKQKALAAFERAVALDPARADFHNNLGFALMGAGRWPEAERRLRRGLAVDPASVRIRQNLAICLVFQDREQEALRMLAAGGVPEAVALNNLAVAQMRAGRPAAARRLLERAAALDPNLDAVRRNLALVTPASENAHILSPAAEENLVMEKESQP